MNQISCHGFTRRFPLVVVCILSWSLWLFGGMRVSAQREAIPSVSEAGAQETPESQIRSELIRIAKLYKLPSMFAGYQRIGTPFVGSVFGTRKNNSGVQVTLNDQVHLGSCTKAMTATMIARLIDRGPLKHGHLKWETTIAEGLPELVKQIDPSFADVTLRQLLMHRGGCPQNTNWAAAGREPDMLKKRRFLVRLGLERASDHEPGQYLYSNLGYVVAGAMAERMTGRAWEDLMREEIFGPLGLRSAGFGVPGTPGKIDQPWGHQSVGQRRVPRQLDNPAPLGPAGTIHMSMADWAKFCLSHTLTKDFETDESKDLKLVSYDTLRALHLPPSDVDDGGQNYACGWRVFERKWGGTVLTHNGSNTMWFAVVWVSPENQSVYLAATNIAGSEVGKGLDEIFSTLIRLEKESRKVKLNGNH